MTETIRVSKINEVYNHLDCDRGVAREISDYFTFHVPGYQWMPAYRNKYWDGKIRLFNTSKNEIYAGLMHRLEKFSKERNYDLIYQYDNSSNNFSLLEANEFIEKQKLSMEPRDYQIKALVDAIRYDRQLFLSPTASGKSFIIYMILRRLLKQTLIIVPTTTLVHQLASDFKEYGFDSDKFVHKIYAGQDKNINKPIVISTWQSIYKLTKKWFDRFEVVIGDEAHLFKAKSLTSIMTKLEKCKHRFGFTGTLDDTLTHKLVLEGLFGPVNRVATTKELMEKNYLADFRIKIIVLSYEDANRKLISTKKYHEEMDFLTSYEPRNRFIKNLSLSLEGNTLLLFQFVDKHGKVLYNSIKDETNRHVFFVHGSVPGEDRNQIRSIVEKEKNAIIVASYGTFSTGINIKNLHNLIFASPSKSKIRNLQSIGRSLRVTDEKTKATLYDISDNLTWKNKRNYTMNHLMERINIYDSEKFDYKIYNVRLK
jgi:superfamily II DNA or RNA helicase